MGNKLPDSLNKEGRVMIDVGYVIVQIIDALFYSSILFLIASGLSLIYGIMKVLNLAHGAFYMVGAYIAYTIVMWWLHASWPAFIIAPIIAVLSLQFIGVTIERGMIRPLYNKPEELQLLVTFALILIFNDLVKITWGAEYKSYTSLIGGAVKIENYLILYYFLGVIILGFIIAGALWFFFSKTMIGKQMKAVAYNYEIVAALGINTDKISILAFAIGSGLAGLAGAVASPILTAYPGMGTEAIVLSFAIIVIGGMGSIIGSLIGALIAGFARTIMIVTYPVLEVALIYIVMVAVLLIKPIGLFGKEETERR